MRSKEADKEKKQRIVLGSYGALLVPPACVYTFLFLCRDFFVLDVTLVFIRVSGETFFFYSARLFLFGATFFNSARLFLFGATFFYSA